MMIPRFPAGASLVLVALALAVSPSLRAAPAWVERSNGDSAVLLKAIGSVGPEEASSLGLRGYDSEVMDLGPGRTERVESALKAARVTLKASLEKEADPQVREDLQILIQACDLRIERGELDERLMLRFIDVGQLVFYGELFLLQDQASAERRPAALARLRKYTGIEPGTKPATELAKALFEQSCRKPGRLGPFRGDVEQALASAASYARGVRGLFEKNPIAGAGPALDALDAQLKDYAAWARSSVLARARDDFRQPPEAYALDLRQVGLGITPQELISKAELEYTEAQNELKALAPMVARERGFQASDYRTVIRELKKEQMAKDDIEPYYREIIGKVEDVIRRERIISLPDRPLLMRFASEAETAALPAPHYQPPPIIGNRGERGEFILPLVNPQATGKAALKFDDFTFKAAAWTLTAHEGRPGHDLQYASMVERGVSQARSIFAFNSVNVEGWALYAEAELKPFEPLEGQMIALQLRLLRAARAILDPMLNLGMITRERAHDILTGDVVLSEAFAGEELDRYTFLAPGQATSYFYGYTRLMELRASTEFALGARFDRYAFNNFIVGQGLLPPDLIAAAVKSEFIPSQK